MESEPVPTKPSRIYPPSSCHCYLDFSTKVSIRWRNVVFSYTFSTKSLIWWTNALFGRGFSTKTSIWWTNAWFGKGFSTKDSVWWRNMIPNYSFSTKTLIWWPNGWSNKGFSTKPLIWWRSRRGGWSWLPAQSSPELLWITGGDFFAAECFKTLRNQSVIPAPQL